MKHFFSTNNLATVAILWALVFFMGSLLYIDIKSESTSSVHVLMISIIIMVILWILFDTRYVIRDGFLFYRSGPFRGRIDIQKIQKIEYFSGMHVPVTMKPALDTKGFIITYDTLNEVYVSPQKKEKFISELLEINPGIVVVK
ncbi:MAG: PH domain-containing protein [Flavobacterium psychrophilum]